MRSPVSASGGTPQSGTMSEPQVRAMFDRISPAYDRMNRIMSLGMDGSWRGLAVRCSGVGAGDEIADHMVSLDRQASLDVAEHRRGHG